MINIRFVFCGLSILGSGCSPWSGSFDCPVGEGMRCSSLSMVNTKMDKGEIDSVPYEIPSKLYVGDEMMKTLEGGPWI